MSHNEKLALFREQEQYAREARSEALGVHGTATRKAGKVGKSTAWSANNAKSGRMRKIKLRTNRKSWKRYIAGEISLEKCKELQYRYNEKHGLPHTF